VRIRFTARTVYETGGRGLGPVFEAGSEHDLDEAFARRWLRRGVAVELTEAEIAAAAAFAEALAQAEAAEAAAAAEADAAAAKAAAEAAAPAVAKRKGG